jgi:hypothetical protein
MHLQVWFVDGSAKTALPKEDLGKFHSGDCYIILYTYHSGEKREEFYLTYWIGKDSIPVISLSLFPTVIYNAPYFFFEMDITHLTIFKFSFLTFSGHSPICNVFCFFACDHHTICWMPWWCVFIDTFLTFLSFLCIIFCHN